MLEGTPSPFPSAWGVFSERYSSLRGLKLANFLLRFGWRTLSGFFCDDSFWVRPFVYLSLCLSICVNRRATLSFLFPPSPKVKNSFSLAQYRRR